MKWLLRFFPRPVLIRLSLLFQPLLRFFFKGRRFQDPIDGSGYRKFLPYGYGTCLRPNALCPGTLSLERHRLLWLYLDRQTDFFRQPLIVLHVAPEQIFYQRFKAMTQWQYTTVDLHSPLADIKADIGQLPFGDNQFDLILCNHVLEHIPHDLKAMQELYRVLKKGGTLIAQVPLDENREQTYENDRITAPKERSQHFGQYDHVRVYGRDYYHRLEAVGFRATAFDMVSGLSPEEIRRFGVQRENIPIATK
jgi:SAM-dependent methyltransferase